MKTTFKIDDTLMEQLERDLPTFKSGSVVDVADRDALYDAMERR
jgi:hypothetical protein